MIYDYHCTQCKTELSVERSIHEYAANPSCFDCHIEMTRKWQAPAVTFKGKGFYSTDR